MEREKKKENGLKYLSYFKKIFGEYEYHTDTKEKTK